MHVDELAFHLPPNLIAPAPLQQRDQSRLLRLKVLGQQAVISDHKTCDLPVLLRAGDLIVVNDARVIPSRVYGRARGHPIELTLYQAPGEHQWLALARPAKRLRNGDDIAIAPDVRLLVVDSPTEGKVTLNWPNNISNPLEWLRNHGSLPLPGYLKRMAQASDLTGYQTIFAKTEGAIAAPTAGLHFTPTLLSNLRSNHIEYVTVTLHVGPGTFLPIRTPTLEEHSMHPELGQIRSATAAKINTTKAAGGRVIAIGTTVLRLLESALRPDGTVAPFSGQTNLYITPGYRIRSVDLLLTNFHQPRSTPLVLVAAFAGLSPIRAAYEHAAAKGYRFYSYGDCCLLENTSLTKADTI